MKFNPYQVLGIGSEAHEAEIRRAARDLASMYHPDKTDGDTEKMKDVNKARDILLDPARRRTFDLTGEIYDEVHEANLAKNLVMDAAHSALGRPDGHDANLISVVRETLRLRLAAVAAARVDFSQERIKAAATRRRVFSFCADENIFDKMFEDRAHNIETTLLDLAQQHRVLKAALKILDDYTWLPAPFGLTDQSHTIELPLLLNGDSHGPSPENR